MAIQTYAIPGTGQPATVLPVGISTKSTIYNPSSTLTVFISEMTGGVFFPVSPGTTVSWDAGKPLYIKCASDATVYVLDNEGDINNPAILADLIVDSGLGTAVANALVASALAGNIGNAVPVPPSAAAIGAAVPVPPSAASIGAAVGGAVPVPPSAAAIGAAVPVPPSAASIGAAVGGAVPVPPSAAAIGTDINTRGVPPIDRPSTFVNTTVPVVIPVTGANLFFGPYDVRQFRSLALAFSIDEAAQGGGVLHAFTIEINWQMTAGGQYVNADVYRVESGMHGINIPIQGQYVSITIFSDGPGNYTMDQTYIFASMAECNTPDCGFFPYTTGAAVPELIRGRNGTGLFTRNSAIGIFQSVASSTTRTVAPPYRPGRAQVTCRVSSSVTAGDIQFRMYDANGALLYFNYLKHVPLNQGLFVDTQEILIPASPIRVDILAAGAITPSPSSCYFYVVYLD